MCNKFVRLEILKSFFFYADLTVQMFSIILLCKNRMSISGFFSRQYSINRCLRYTYTGLRVVYSYTGVRFLFLYGAKELLK